MKCVVCLEKDATMMCCPLGKFCSEECIERHMFILAPHTCVVAQVYDPPCDLKTSFIAEKLHEMLSPNSTLLKNDKPRRIVDGNRLEGYNEPFRKELREMATTGSYIIEVHSFHRSSDFNVSDDVDIVILSMYRDDGMEDLFLNGLTNAVVREGHKTVNDIGYEAHKMGWKHVMLEFRDTLSVSKIMKHLKEIKEIIY